MLAWGRDLEATNSKVRDMRERGGGGDGVVEITPMQVCLRQVWGNGVDKEERGEPGGMNSHVAAGKEASPDSLGHSACSNCPQIPGGNVRPGT